jgi:hypothetical protein
LPGQPKTDILISEESDAKGGVQQSAESKKAQNEVRDSERYAPP